jgi:AraC family transcriptional activator of pobA
MEIKNYKFKADSILKVEVVNLKTLLSSNKGHLVTPHRTNFYHVFLFENCQPKHVIDFISYKVKPYSLLFIDKDKVHQFDQLLNYEGRVLIFTEDFFCTTENDLKFLRSTTLFNDINNNPQLNIDKKLFPKYSSIADDIYEEGKLPPDTSKQIILKNLLHNFLLLAEREKLKNKSNENNKGVDLDYALLFKDLLDKHFKTDKSVSYYANKIHVSEKKLGQSTAKILGKMPKELIDERVILEAKRLLVHGNKTIKEVGFVLGFEEPTNFIKYFRKHTLKTPVEFRELHLFKK